ncbi:maestro heat-like repeat-containing protein family member 6 isoform X1 [Hirundo rustica]|uniref:maestro heat-like repeat-containing protein family member 6 isoform X1 n=1 Tax=Hirundo rustica TaxID=43150 RepID=UPI001A94214F|nr:maestro heat-like repeat-containing protein family member 6 isoform X1 [Hirundo rustica]XP_039926197.1 maestro heat-like repeat-containing protein family member 6 isoform X1 [Hirundo rustica]XP_039926198.1 maestro heat-like repeat-containing protein family member 6 isoform X1 [Hirundo rustica]XP_039926199.1 maestro heat-like repeat-containing protein family member 6 isoform X1 [Hirundo rustica]
MAEKRLGLFRMRKNKGSSAASAKQPKAAAQSQPVQDGKKRTQEQDRGHSDRTLKMFPKFMSHRKTNKNTEGTDKFGSRPTDVSTASIECAEMTNYVVKADQVPAMVRIMHERLSSPVTADVRLFMNILRMADEHPPGVVLTLLRCAPTCDRAAAMMWRNIGSSSPTVERVLPTLLSVMEDWPLHSMFTSDGDDTGVFALAATLALWVIIQVPKCHEAMHNYAPHLLVALLVQIFDSTEHGAEEVDAFWMQCQEEHHLDTNPSRFAVQTMKALLCRLQCDNVVTEMGRKCGWDTLLCAQTQHYAMGLLAREMRRDLMPLCFRIACHLLGLLSTAGHRWDRPFLAFLVEVFDCLDLSECRDRVLEMMSRYLQSECRERGRLALRGLMVLIKDPLIARRMGILSQRLVDVLGDADREVVRLSLSVFMNVLQYKDILISSTTAPKLAEALLPLFDHDHSHVQLLSIQLFEKVMDLVVDQGKKPLKRTVSQSLLPLFLHCHDENQHVANASMETLLCAARFLKKRSLKQAVKKEMPMKFGKCLLQENRSRAAELLLQALPYLESPQEPLREAAIRFIGMAARYLKGQPGELHVLSQALEAMSKDDSPSSTNLEIQAIFGQRCAELRSSAGFGEPVSQEQYQEPVKRTSPLSVTGEPGMDDARHS